MTSAEENTARLASQAAIGARIRELREARDIRPGELAALAGCSKGHISNIERGRSRVTDPIRVALAAALDVPVADLEAAS